MKDMTKDPNELLKKIERLEKKLDKVNLLLCDVFKEAYIAHAKTLPKISKAMTLSYIRKEVK